MTSRCRAARMPLATSWTVPSPPAATTLAEPLLGGLPCEFDGVPGVPDGRSSNSAPRWRGVRLSSRFRPPATGRRVVNHTGRRRWSRFARWWRKTYRRARAVARAAGNRPPRRGQPAALARYLRRNPGCSFVAWPRAGELVGVSLAGHDGRRGYLHHVAVARRAGRRNRPAAGGCLPPALKAEGIEKVHPLGEGRQRAGTAFWNRVGGRERPDIVDGVHQPTWRRERERL